MDVILILEKSANDMERTREYVLIIFHQDILRILYAYFVGIKGEDSLFAKVTLNHVIRLSPMAYRCKDEGICLIRK